MKVRTIKALRQLADVMGRLETRLVGNLTSDTIEGLEVEVVAPNGKLALWAWSDVRESSGAFQIAKSLRQLGPGKAIVQTETVKFPDLTRGPQASQLNRLAHVRAREGRRVVCDEVALIVDIPSASPPKEPMTAPDETAQNRAGHARS